MKIQRARRSHPMADHDTPMKDRDIRTACELVCALTVAGETREVVLADFTDRGFQVICDFPLPIATKAALTIPGCLPVAAAVRWSLGRRAGFAFERPVQRETLAAAVDAAAAAMRRHRD